MTAISVWGRHSDACPICKITSPELTDKMLADFLDMKENLIVNIHVQPVDPKAAIKSLKNILSNIPENEDRGAEKGSKKRI